MPRNPILPPEASYVQNRGDGTSRERQLTEKELRPSWPRGTAARRRSRGPASNSEAHSGVLGAKKPHLSPVYPTNPHSDTRRPSARSSGSHPGDSPWFHPPRRQPSRYGRKRWRKREGPAHGFISRRRRTFGQEVPSTTNGLRASLASPAQFHCGRLRTGTDLTLWSHMAVEQRPRVRAIEFQVNWASGAALHGK
jgi:hypothetical protein